MLDTYKGFTFTVDQMDQADILDPREQGNNYGTLALFHKRLNLGDRDPKDVDGSTVSMTRAQEIEADTANYVSLPVYGYDHGNMRVSTTPFGDRFDSGKLGCIFIHKSKCSKAVSPDGYLEYLRGEVEDYDKYLNGEVYCYSIKSGLGAVGSYGDQYMTEASALEDAQAAIDELVENGVLPPSSEADPTDTATAKRAFDGLVRAGVLPEPSRTLDVTTASDLPAALEVVSLREAAEVLEEPVEETANDTVEIDGCFIG